MLKIDHSKQAIRPTLVAALVCCCALSSCNRVQANQNTPNGQNKGNGQDQVLSGPVKFMAAWGTKGKDPGQFQSPEWLATDATGNVFVADAEAKAIEKFTF